MVQDYSQFNTIIKVLLYTGMRSGECLALRWQDIDFENRTIHIENTLTDVGGKHWLQPPKTATSNRFIGLSDVLADILKEHKEQQNIKKRLPVAFTNIRKWYLQRKAEIILTVQDLIHNSDDL